MRPGIRYYCPPGVAAPAHRPEIGGGGKVDDGHGPDVAAGGPGGGLVYGGIYADQDTGWVRTDAGWWVNLGTTMPQHLWRPNTNPRIVRWAVIEGAQPEHRWRVPVLLTPEPSTGDDAPRAYVSALERVWRGGAGWVDEPELADLADQVHAVCHGVSLNGLTGEWPAITELALRLYQEGARVTRHEIAAGGWLSERMLLRTLIAAADTAQPEPVA